MKKFRGLLGKMVIVACATCCVVGGLTGCGKSGTYSVDGDEVDDVIDVPEVGEIPVGAVEAEGDITDSDFSKYAGEYKAEDGSTITIGADNNITIALADYDVLKGTAFVVAKGIMPISASAPDGETIGFEFNVDTHELIVVDSLWSKLENGTTFVFDK